MAHPMSSAAYGYSHQPRSGSMDHGTAGHFRSYPTSQGHPHNPSSACSRRPEERYRRAEAGAVGDPRSSDKVKMTWQPCTNGNGLNLFVLNGEGVFTRAVTVPVPHSPPFGAISRAILRRLGKKQLDHPVCPTNCGGGGDAPNARGCRMQAQPAGVGAASRSKEGAGVDVGRCFPADEAAKLRFILPLRSSTPFQRRDYQSPATGQQLGSCR